MTIKTKISKLKSSAKSRGLAVNLMDYEYESLLNLCCHYCGKDILSENGYCLDRIDSDKGYYLHNVVGCCKICNRAKNDMDFGDFVNWIEKAYKFQQNIILQLQNSNVEYSFEQEKQLHKALKTENSFYITNRKK